VSVVVAIIGLAMVAATIAVLVATSAYPEMRVPIISRAL